MTCVVGLITSNGDILFGADSQVTTDDSKITLLDKKIFKKNNMIMGFCGDLKFGQLIKHRFTPPIPGRNVDIDNFIYTKFVPELQKFFIENGFQTFSRNESFTLLLGIEKNIYSIDDDYAVIPASQRYFAIGSGGDYALGSLHATRSNPNYNQRLQMSLDAAITYSSTCSKPFHFESLLHTPSPDKKKKIKAKPKSKKKK